MSTYEAPRYLPLGPILSGVGSRAFLGADLSGSGLRAVALIWVPDELVRDPVRFARLEAETTEAARIEHANVLRVLGVARLDEGIARVTEFADGETLRRVLDEGKTRGRALSPLVAARIAVDACAGVAAAALVEGTAPGTRPFSVHGDLRPETILVSFEGITKVAGYGALAVAPREADGRRVVHRRDYAAPEQLRGGRSAATRATDVYAVGAVLFEILSGGALFGDRTDFETAAIGEDAPALPPDRAPEPLRRAVARCLARDPAARFSDVGELRTALLDVLAGGALAGPSYVKLHLAELFPIDSAERTARRRLLASAAALAGDDPPAPTVAVTAATSTAGPDLAAAAATAQVIHAPQTATETSAASVAAPTPPPTPAGDAPAAPRAAVGHSPTTEDHLEVVQPAMPAGGARVVADGRPVDRAVPIASVLSLAEGDPTTANHPRRAPPDPTPEAAAAAMLTGPAGSEGGSLATTPAPAALAPVIPAELAPAAPAPAELAPAELAPAVPAPRPTAARPPASADVAPVQGRAAAVATGPREARTAPRATARGPQVDVGGDDYEPTPSKRSTGPLALAIASFGGAALALTGAWLLRSPTPAEPPALPPAEIPLAALPPPGIPDPAPPSVEPRPAPPAPPARSAATRAARSAPPSAPPKAVAGAGATMELTGPPGAAVFVDGVAVGTTPLRAPLPLSPGRRMIRVTLGKGVYETPLVARAGQEYTLDVGFETTD